MAPDEACSSSDLQRIPLVLKNHMLDAREADKNARFGHNDGC